jgi:hypothetical protein
VSGPTGSNDASTASGDDADLQVVTLQTAKGPVDVLFYLRPEGDTLHVKDLAIYSQTEAALSGVLRDLLAARTQLMAYAKEVGFAKLQITGSRTLGSSSANPGKVVDVTIRL